MNKWNNAPVAADVAPARARAAAPKAAAGAIGGNNIALLRRKALGNNCGFIADAYPGGMKIVTAEELGNERVIIRWGTTTPIGAVNKKAIVINKADAITETSNKGAFRLKAHKAGLTPRTWATLEALGNENDPPEAVIIRPEVHERSENISLCRTLDEANKAIAACKGQGYYISEYIKKDREFRVFVAQGRAFMVFEKQPKNKADVSWGCVEEGALKYVGWSEWPLHVVENAIKAFNISNLDFGAVDVIEKAGKAYFLEINTAPEVWPYYGELFADVFNYMLNKTRERIAVKFSKNWKDYIHPSITKKAIV